MTGFAAAKTTPAADGTFSIGVTSPGMYNISVYPHELNLANITTNTSYLYQYPDNQVRFQSARVNNDTRNAVIQISGRKGPGPHGNRRCQLPTDSNPDPDPGLWPDPAHCRPDRCCSSNRIFEKIR